MASCRPHYHIEVVCWDNAIRGKEGEGEGEGEKKGYAIGVSKNLCFELYQGISYGFDWYLGVIITTSLSLPYYHSATAIATVMTFFHYVSVLFSP